MPFNKIFKKYFKNIKIKDFKKLKKYHKMLNFIKKNNSLKMLKK